MSRQFSKSRLVLLTLGLALLCAARWTARPVERAPRTSHALEDPVPRINKVEPPNWWVGLLPNPMLLLTGENLAGAQVSVAHPAVRVSRYRANPDGHYLFVWLELRSGIKPGRVPITIRTPTGSTVVELPLLARRGPEGNFQGLGEDDVVYLIMPDRFADGDPTNNFQQR